MSYTKHNFTTGEILYASQMRDIDNAIYDIDARTSTLETAAGSIGNAASIRSDLDNALVVGRQRTGQNNQNADLMLDPGSYIVDYGCSNTPYHDSRYYDYGNSPNAYGYIFVYGFRDKVNAGSNLLCQLFIEGARDLTPTEILKQTLNPNYSPEVGKIYTRYYTPSNSTWGDWIGYVSFNDFNSRMSDIESRLNALEHPSGGGGEEDKD